MPKLMANQGPANRATVQPLPANGMSSAVGTVRRYETHIARTCPNRRASRPAKEAPSTPPTPLTAMRRPTAVPESPISSTSSSITSGRGTA